MEVNFSCLETTVNLETWVLVLEFIGIGGKFVNPELFTRLAQQARIEEMASGIDTVGVYQSLVVALILSWLDYGTSDQPA